MLSPGLPVLIAGRMMGRVTDSCQLTDSKEGDEKAGSRDPCAGCCVGKEGDGFLLTE